MKRLASILLCVSSLPLSAATFTVTNTDDSGPGSLRQALTDAQGCVPTVRLSPSADSPSGGGHLIAFDVPGGLLTNGVAVITPLTPLPEITCPGTTVDGTTQTANGGNTNDVTLGAGGTVGTGPDGVAGTGDEFALPQLNGPEVQIQGTSGLGTGLAVDADDVTIRGLAVYGFGSAGGNLTGNILVRDVANTLIEGNVLGASATAFTSTGAAFANNVSGTALVSQVGSGTIVRNNLIGFSGSSGIIALGPGSLIEGNEIRACGSTQVDDAIATLATPYTIRRNLIVDSAAIGIDVGGGDAPITISENTLSGNGFGSSTERCGAFVGSSGGGIVSLNVFTGNANAALIPTTTGIRISKNSIHDNGTIGIDLVQALNRIGDGVTANDVGDGDGGPNAGQNFPLIESVEHLGPQGAGSTRILGNFHSSASTTFELEFFANPGCLPFPRQFLEGETYLGSTQVTTDGSGNAAIDVTLPIATEAGVRISATATDPAGNTSEFSQRIIFSITPASGPAAGGTALTASGTDFVDPTTMTIGGLSVPVTFVDAQTSNATSPALAPGTFNDVVVNTPANMGVLTNGWVADFLDVPSGTPVPRLRHDARLQHASRSGWAQATTVSTSRRCAARWPSSC